MTGLILLTLFWLLWQSGQDLFYEFEAARQEKKLQGPIEGWPHWKIDVARGDWRRVEEVRAEAMRNRRLHVSDGDWVPFTLEENGKSLKGKMRLKGDFGDHWRADKGWSFRVHLGGDSKLLGMSRFAIQQPHTRNYMNEVYFHAFLRRLGLIARRYEFVFVTMNGQLQPLYAVEENDGPELLAANGRPPGIQFHLSPEASDDLQPGLPFGWYFAPFEAYNAGMVRKDPSLNAELERTRMLVDRLRTGAARPGEILDVEKWGDFLALVDLLGGHHPTSLSNLRFYSNPETGRIEPVGYDNSLIEDVRTSGLTASARVLGVRAGSMVDPSPCVKKDWPRWMENPWLDVLFGDEQIHAAYMGALDRMSSPGWLEKEWEAIEAETASKQKLLRTCFPSMPDTAHTILFRNRDTIRRYLHPLLAVSIRRDRDTGELVAGNLIDLPVELDGFARGAEPPWGLDGTVRLEARCGPVPSFVVIAGAGKLAELDLDDPGLQIVGHVVGIHDRFRHPTSGGVPPPEAKPGGNS